MIFAIIFIPLFIILIAILFIFTFVVLEPSLRQQKISLDKALFSENEIRLKTAPSSQFSKADGQVAVVLCSHEKNCNTKRYDYSSMKSCALYSEINDSEHDCIFGCIGFGDCAKSCTRNAISIINSTAFINRSLCNGCGKCISACPKQCITLIDIQEKSKTLCKAPDINLITCNQKNSVSDINKTEGNTYRISKKLYNIIKGK